MDRASFTNAVNTLLMARNSDPFAFLGPHVGPAGPDPAEGEKSPRQKAGAVARSCIRVFHPHATYVTLLKGDTNTPIGEMRRLHDGGVFGHDFADAPAPGNYRLRITENGHTFETDDPYRFGALLTDLDRYLLAEGTHLDIYHKMGAHPCTIDGVFGTSFAVWAPNARRVSVVGDFNGWDGRVNPMRFHPGSGVWDIFLPGVTKGARYKYEIVGPDGTLLPQKFDPYAFYSEKPPLSASVVWGLGDYHWHDQAWMAERAAKAARNAPISIYEVHLGSWQRGENDRLLTYTELADRLIPYVNDMGFTHVELLPISEYPFDGSWGYQPIGLYAPTSRYGTPDDFKTFVDRLHQAGIGIILDWVAGHFPEDAHGLGLFDGSHLYEHADPRQGRHMDWGTLIFNYGRNEVRNFLIANALYWLDQYHIDGLRVDAVASMLYLDYSRKQGEWIPNRYGRRENLEAIDFLRQVNTLVYDRFPGAMTIAEESTAWPMVSRPVHLGGLGFGYKWNMGWMNDTLRYMHYEPIHRRYHQNELTFGLLYAFTENFVLPLSHDEVVHGKGSILSRMPGDAWQQFANIRAYYAYMWAYPGKKLLFMGSEFAQGAEWNYARSLDWHLLDHDWHKGVQALIRDLNRLYTDLPALHQRDNEGDGFCWVDCSDWEQSVIAFLRYGMVTPDGSRPVALVVCNFTPVVRHNYRLGVPHPGLWEERLNTDSLYYCGSNVGNGQIKARPVPSHGQPQSLELTLPPLSTLVFTPVS